MQVQTFLLILATVLATYTLGLGAYLYEDNIYYYYARSIMQDLDFNIINQVPENMARIVTEKFSHPAHHTILHTPLIIGLLYLEDLILQYLGGQLHNTFVLGGTFLSLLCLSVGYWFSAKAAVMLGLQIRLSHFAFFVLSTSLLYFSFFTLTVIDIFLFAISSFAFYGFLLIKEDGPQTINTFILGIAVTILISAKITYITFFLLVLITIFIKAKKNGIRHLVQFLAGAGIIALIAALKDMAAFGQVVMLSKSMSVVMSYTWLDLIQTLKQGVLGEGGLFYANPTYFLGLVGFIWFSIERMLKNKNDILTYLCLLGWMGLSYFQTTFLVGPILEDHLVGRVTLTSLTIMLIGLVFLESKVFPKVKAYHRWILYLLLAMWQMFVLGNYLTISMRGHYAYAENKVVGTIGELQIMLEIFINQRLLVWKMEYMAIIVFVMLTTSILYFLHRYKSRLTLVLSSYLVASSLMLLGLNLYNLENSEKNGKKFLDNSISKEQFTITNEPSVYSFIYVVDILRSQMLNAKSFEMKELIKSKHEDYLKSIEPHLLQVSPDLRRAIQTKDLSFGFYD